MNMNFVIGTLFLITGAIGVFHPSFFYKVEKLTPEKIARNKRLWNCGGAGLILMGILDLAFTLFWK